VVTPILERVKTAGMDKAKQELADLLAQAAEKAKAEEAAEGAAKAADSSSSGGAAAAEASSSSKEGEQQQEGSSEAKELQVGRDGVWRTRQCA
jgi:hypothetical protein